ncbi:MAG: hypothetical protein ACRED3_15115 [Bradyrhizobium sp.]
MQPDFPLTNAPDEEITPMRQQGLALLPASMPELEEALGDVRIAQEFLRWGTKTKRVKWNQDVSAYVKLDGRR